MSAAPDADPDLVARTALFLTDLDSEPGDGARGDSMTV